MYHTLKINVIYDEKKNWRPHFKYMLRNRHSQFNLHKKCVFLFEIQKQLFLKILKLKKSKILISSYLFHLFNFLKFVSKRYMPLKPHSPVFPFDFGRRAPLLSRIMSHIIKQLGN